jgi:hypothetical protein
MNKQKRCLEIVYELLQLEGEDAVDPFYLDDNGLNGLDYLLMPDKEGHNSGYFLVSYRVYTDLLVKYIELYYKNNPDDPVLHRNLQKICSDQLLFELLEQPLRRGIGLLLHTYCKPVKPTVSATVELAKPAYTETEAYDSLPLAEQMEHGIAIPVSPGRNFVTEEEEEQYERQPIPEDLRAYREAEKRGGLRKQKRSKNKNKQFKRKTRKPRKSRKNKKTSKSRKN